MPHATKPPKKGRDRGSVHDSPTVMLERPNQLFLNSSFIAFLDLILQYSLERLMAVESGISAT